MGFVAKTFDELTAKEIYEILKSRAMVFQMEQGIHFVDPDDVDYDSIHIFRMTDGRVDAYLRAYRTEETADDTLKIGRVLTLEHGNGLGTELMKYAIHILPEMTGCKKIIMDAQKQAEAFYKRLGFVVTSDEYMEEGVVHIDMSLEL